ncbi:MAG: pirin family protein [Acidimicrobiia bacterium]|nr:pirin family protein [Acidimicrobiia bacterium]
MSGPVTPTGDAGTTAADQPEACELELIDGRRAEVGGFTVNRLLPRRARRTVGPWCFVDHMGPNTVDAANGLDVGPHPHIGLQTVTWLVRGEVLHTDSLGSEQLVRPGQLNLMTAGAGIAHAEQTSGVHVGELHGVQLWVAQPSATRDTAPAFEHHAELPGVELEHGQATVIVGALAGVESPARRDTEHLGAELLLVPGTSQLALDPGHEYALAVLEGSVSVRGGRLVPGRLGYLGTEHDEVTLDVDEPVRALLLGGEPLGEELLMWWNYVARTRDEITAAHRSWVDDDGRFAPVRSPLERIVVDDPPWSRGH